MSDDYINQVNGRLSMRKILRGLKQVIAEYGSNEAKSILEAIIKAIEENE